MLEASCAEEQDRAGSTPGQDEVAGMLASMREHWKDLQRRKNEIVMEIADRKIAAGDYRVVSIEDGYRPPRSSEYSHLRFQDGELRAVEIDSHESRALMAVQAEMDEFARLGSEWIRTHLWDDPQEGRG